MGEASDDIKLTTGSVVEISRLPGYILQTKGNDTRVNHSKLSIYSIIHELCKGYRMHSIQVSVKFITFSFKDTGTQ